MKSLSSDFGEGVCGERLTQIMDYSLSIKEWAAGLVSSIHHYKYLWCMRHIEPALKAMLHEDGSITGCLRQTGAEFSLELFL